jgi:UDP-N-acetylglucosamine 2-epimerase (non-hydrolysing)
VLLVAGTRPECLKLAPVVAALREHGNAPLLLNSGQHDDMVRRTFAHLGMVCDLAPGQLSSISLSATVRALRERIREAACTEEADLIVAQGDTSTAYATALAARDLCLPLAHVEAGLRTDHPWRPFPEELFRRRIAPIAAIHFAPTVTAVGNLLAENIPADCVHLVGNTAIDLLRHERERAMRTCLPFLPGTRSLVTLTLHRRENYGRGLDIVCEAILDLLAAEPQLGVVCPLHPNPVVGGRIRRHLSGHARIALTPPLDYRDFIALLMCSRLAITDSGGIQEEAPYLGLPVLVVRENTERPEGVALGCARLTPLQRQRIFSDARQLLHEPPSHAVEFDADAPYGDGRSGGRIAAAILSYLRRTDDARQEIAVTA